MLCKPAEGDRRPAEVVAESNKQGVALMEYVVQALEAGGFEVSTAEWPRVSIRVGDRTLLLGVGGLDADSQRLATVLRRALALVEGAASGRSESDPAGTPARPLTAERRS